MPVEPHPAFVRRAAARILVCLAAHGGIAVAGEEGMPQPGDCALYREGGAGYILTTPTYFVRGTIVEVLRRPHRMGLCPDPRKPRERYTRADWKALADAYPCVSREELAKDVEAIRIRLRVDEWDTPWSSQHGHNGWLYRGHFLETELKSGVVLDIDGTLLERCTPRQ